MGRGSQRCSGVSPGSLAPVNHSGQCCCSLQEQAGWCVWDLAPGRSLSPCPSDAMESSKQERALPLLAALPALGLDAGDKRLDGTAGQVPTLLPSVCCQLRSVRKYQAGREGSASHGCLEMIDIFMVKLGFLGSSIPSTWQVPGLRLARTCWALCCPQALKDMPRAGLHPKSSPEHPQLGAGTR